MLLASAEHRPAVVHTALTQHVVILLQDEGLRCETKLGPHTARNLLRDILLNFRSFIRHIGTAVRAGPLCGLCCAAGAAYEGQHVPDVCHKVAHLVLHV